MVVISASRRTDLPRFHIHETVEMFKRGVIEMVNPYNGVPYSIDLSPENVDCIVWWSKDYSEYIRDDSIVNFFSKYNQMFHFTINGYKHDYVSSILEPGVTSSLEERLKQARMLAKMFSPGQVSWRFDPVVFWNDDNRNGMQDNLLDFYDISWEIGKAGITRCHVAFADLYAKFKNRVQSRYDGSVRFHAETVERRREISRKLAWLNKENGIVTYSCSHDEILDEKNSILKSHCIDADLINSLFHLDMKPGKDPGQRDDCGCFKSKDIGRYEQGCGHRCIYCYANPDDK